MGGRHRNWHRAWRMVQGELHHESGLVVRAVDGELEAYPDSVGDCREHELARGVPAHALDMRLNRLMWEAGQWQPN